MKNSQLRAIDKALRFLHENGAYIFLTALASRTPEFVRNRLLARRLGVKRIRIGPGSYLRGLSCIRMGENFSAGQGLWLEAVTHYQDELFSPRLVVGNDVHISHWSHIACTNSITIGDHVLIGSKVMITDHNHGTFESGNATSPTIPPELRRLESRRFVRIESNVWLADGVVVCPGVTLGQGSVAGANAVITSDVAPFTLVTGIPARAVRRYDADSQAWVGIDK